MSAELQVEILPGKLLTHRASTGKRRGDKSLFSCSYVVLMDLTWFISCCREKQPVPGCQNPHFLHRAAYIRISDSQWSTSWFFIACNEDNCTANMSLSH